MHSLQRQGLFWGCFTQSFYIIIFISKLVSLRQWSPVITGIEILIGIHLYNFSNTKFIQKSQVSLCLILVNTNSLTTLRKLCKHKQKQPAVNCAEVAVRKYVTEIPQCCLHSLQAISPLSGSIPGLKCLLCARTAISLNQSLFLVLTIPVIKRYNQHLWWIK